MMSIHRRLLKTDSENWVQSAFSLCYSAPLIMGLMLSFLQISGPQHMHSIMLHQIDHLYYVLQRVVKKIEASCSGCSLAALS